jgi:hypothetical protein
MIRTLLTLALAAAAITAQAQTTSSGPQQLPTLRDRNAQQPPPSTTAVPPAEPVITITGVCSAPAADPASCKTVVTREQFDRMVGALNSNKQVVPQSVLRNLAQHYVELLAYTQAAEKAGLQNDPKFTEIMRVVRMRTLADAYARSLEDKYRNPPEQDLQAYYSEHPHKYEELTLSRIFVPTQNQSSSNGEDWTKRAAQVLADIRDRAAKGEDLDKLQKEAYTTLGVTVNPLSTFMGKRRMGMMLPEQEQEVFALPAGGVSRIYHEPSGFIIYRVDSKETLPLAQVKDEIAKNLFKEKFDRDVKAIMGSVHADLNGEYFGTEPMPSGAPSLQKPAPPK